ncbi:hypothetical protein LINPERPRIM_LOCUS15022 [Linum perenne]
MATHPPIIMTLSCSLLKEKRLVQMLLLLS